LLGLLVSQALIMFKPLLEDELALKPEQRKKLPDSAFAYPDARKYPVPTKAQAQKAGISEKQRLNIHRNALSRAAQEATTGNTPTVAKKVDQRGPINPSSRAKKKK
jgi:hypothetical protein